MAVCNFEGNSDMYGLGIRLGFYLQWFGGLLAAWIAPSEVKGLRFSTELFVAATFLALIIHTAGDVDSLQHVEIYIVLLLMFGVYLVLIPIYLWRLLTSCDPYWDPTRWPIVNPGRLTSNLSFILLVGVLIYQYWFWFAHIPSLDDINCQQYGFLFGQVRLNSKVSVAMNALAYCFLGVIVLYFLAFWLLGTDDLDGGRQPKLTGRHLKARVNLLRNIEGWIKIVVGLVVALATELTITWNEIDGVNSLAGAGQTIPFVIGLGAIVRIFYVYYVYPPNGVQDGGTTGGSTYNHSKSGSGPGNRPGSGPGSRPGSGPGSRSGGGPGSRPGSRPDGPISKKQFPYPRMQSRQSRHPARGDRAVPVRAMSDRFDHSDRSDSLSPA